MVLGKVEGEVDGQEQQKNWSLWKLEWLQTWTEGQASRLFLSLMFCTGNIDPLHGRVRFSRRFENVPDK